MQRRNLLKVPVIGSFTLVLNIIVHKDGNVHCSFQMLVIL